MNRALHLGDELPAADITAPAPDHVDLQYLEAGGDERLALFQHPNSEVRFRLPRTFRGGQLRTACAVASRAWPQVRGPITFRIGLVSVASELRWLHESRLDPRKRAADRHWQPIELSVPEGAELVLQTSARRTAHAAAGWADPILEWDAPDRPARRERRAQPNVLLITADAIRPSADRAPIPSVTALAADGHRCDGRLVSTMPPSSAASVLTGRYPLSLGLTSEWSPMPNSVPNLATELARAGYHTVFAPGEHLQGRPEQGAGRAFAEVLPCLVNPRQPGDLTTRRVLHWMETVPDDRPWLLWVSYFDTHPPYRFPDEFARRFYDGDPRDPSRASRSDELVDVHTMATMQALDSMLPALRRGIIAGGLIDRLRSTAFGLDGKLESAPDLANHLATLGPGVRRGHSVPEFASWLHARADALEAGVVEPELVEWLDEQLVPALRLVEAESVRWLEGVVDQRYAVAQAEAGAAYVDGCVEELSRHLQSAGLYDECTVVFVGVHVELDGDQAHRAHHLTLTESNLQVPLVIKPRRTAGGFTVPSTVEGPFETVDLVPTVLDSLGLPLPEVDGTSRWSNLSMSTPIADHDSFAVGYDSTEIAMRRGRHKVVRTLTPDTSGARPGTIRLFELTADGDVPINDEVIEKQLVARLDEWLLGTRPG